MKIYELFEDQTVPQLRQNIQTGFPDTKKRQHATNEVRVDNFKYTPFAANGILRVDAITSSNNGNKHKVTIDLRGITFENGDTDQNVTVTSSGGQDISVQPVQLNTTNVGVNCDCQDYIMRFATFNLNQNCHIGAIPPRYIRKTTTRPPANPNNVPGACKHILKCFEDLQGHGLIV